MMPLYIGIYNKYSGIWGQTTQFNWVYLFYRVYFANILHAALKKVSYLHILPFYLFHRTNVGQPRGHNVCTAAVRARLPCHTKHKTGDFEAETDVPRWGRPPPHLICCRGPPRGAPPWGRPAAACAPGAPALSGDTRVCTPWSDGSCSRTPTTSTSGTFVSV